MRLMKFAIAMLLALRFGGSLHAQNPADQVLARLKDRPLFFRGFWTADKLAFDASAKPKASYQVGPFTVAGFRADSANIEDNRLHVEGVRVALTFDGNGAPSRTPIRSGGVFGKKEEKVIIDIDGTGNDDFQAVLSAIFLEGWAELAPAVPDFWKHYVYAQMDGTPLRRMPPFHRSSKSVSAGGNVTKPRLLSAPDPEFSDWARRLHMSGNVNVYLVCDSDGKPSQIQIIRPMGYGLDEKAVQAVSGYRFAPAMRDGVPTSAELFVEVSFRIF